MANEPHELLSRNEAWVHRMQQNEPDLFDRMGAGQQPPFLWIGCADSRVPAEEVTQSLPGTIFVQRNVANLVVPTDYNLLSVVNYAVKTLRVRHMIVCGHYGCGGVKAAMSNASFGLLDNWLAHIKDVYQAYQAELDGMADEDARYRRFIELNVQAQVNNLAKLSFVQDEWKESRSLQLHGWVFDIETGRLKDLGMSVSSADHLASVYRYE